MLSGRSAFSRMTPENDPPGGSCGVIHGVNFPSLCADGSKSLELQNNVNDDIVQNIIYVFTGIQGKYLKKDVISGRFKLDSKVKSLNVVQAGMLLRLSDLGYDK